MKLTVEQITSTRAKWVAREIRLMANPARSTTCAKDAVELRFLIALCDLALAGLREVEPVALEPTLRAGDYDCNVHRDGESFFRVKEDLYSLSVIRAAAPKEPSNG